MYSSHIKDKVITFILENDTTAGPVLHGRLIDLAASLKDDFGTNTARAVQMILTLQNDEAFVFDNENVGINIMDKDCPLDERVCAHLQRLIKKTVQLHKTGQFFVPSQRRFKFLLETKIRPKNKKRLDWLLSYNGRIGKPIRSFPQLWRELAPSVAQDETKDLEKDNANLDDTSLPIDCAFDHSL